MEYATKGLKDQLDDLLHGLKIARDHLSADRKDKASQVLEQAGQMLANAINTTLVIDRSQLR